MASLTISNAINGLGEGGTLSVSAAQGMLAGDIDPFGYFLAVTAVSIANQTANVSGGVATTQGAYGTLTTHADGSYTYSAKNNLSLPADGILQDIFTFTASDGHGNTAQATLTITVTAVGVNYVAAAAGSTVSIGNAPTVIDASLGNVTVRGGNGNDVVLGGFNDKIALGNGNDTVIGGASETITVGNGTDTVSVGANTAVIAGNGNDSITASNNSTIVAGNGNDKIAAGNNSSVALGNGSDTVTAGNSSSIKAGNGNDTVTTGANSNISSGKGVDTITSGPGSTITGGGTNAPTITTPVISGTAREGQMLTASASSNDPIGYAWYSSSDGYTNSIGTGATYLVKEGDEGFTLVAKATATNGAGASTSEFSTPTSSVLDAAPSVTTPTIAGIVQEGQILIASASSGQSDNPVTYSWYSSADGYTNPFGTGATYVVREGDEGAAIEVKATATNDNGATLAAASAPTSAVIDQTLVPVAMISPAAGSSGLPLDGGQSFDRFVGFGDSNIDSGYFLTHPISNNPVKQAQYRASAAVGGGIPTMIGAPMNSQLLAADYGVTGIPDGMPGGTNYAAGGALIIGQLPNSLAPSVQTQIQTYLSDVNNVADPNALYLINAGSNDNAAAPDQSPQGQIDFMLQEAQALANGLAQIHADGGRHFAIVTPAGALGTTFDNALWSDLAALGVNFFVVDKQDFVSSITPGSAIAQQYGITNFVHPPAGPFTAANPYDPTNGGADINPIPSSINKAWAYYATQTQANAQTYLWADDEHLAAAGQRAVADYTYNALQNAVPVPGETLSARVSLLGSAPNSITNVSIQWQSSTDNGATWTAIAGATQNTYTVQESDENSELRVHAVVTNDTGQTSDAYSAATPTVLDNPPTVTTPAITGTAQESQTLTASASAGENDDAVTYAWYSSADGYTNSIGTGATYAVQEADEGSSIEVKATATNDNGANVSATSASTAAVVDNANLALSLDVLGNAGSPIQEGQILVARVSVSGDSDDLSAPIAYQWQTSSDGGATWSNVSATTSGQFGGGLSSFYQLGEADEGNVVRVQASFTDDTGQAVSATTAPTVPVADVTPILSVPFSYTVDEFKVVTATQTFDDTFSNGPPPIGSAFGPKQNVFQTSAGGGGSTWSEGLNSLGQPAAVMSSTGAAFNGGDNSVQALLVTNNAPEGTGPGESNGGLKENGTFTVSGTFDLVAPQPGTDYGIALVNVPAPTAEEVQLQLQRWGNSATVVLNQSDPVDGIFNTIASYTLAAQQLSGNNEIELDLAHATANSSTVTASFKLIDNGTVTFSDSFSPPMPAHIFNDSTAARAEIQGIDSTGQYVTILGTAQEGQALAANTSTNDSDATINYQWQSSADGLSWNNIAGAADSKTYVVQESDEGLTVRVIASTTDPDNGQTASAISAATSAVLDGAPTVTVPTITGTAQEGATLTASATAGESDDAVTYAWYSSADNNTNAIGTGATYQVQQGDTGNSIEVKATATNENGITTTATSIALAVLPPTDGPSFTGATSGSDNESTANVSLGANVGGDADDNITVSVTGLPNDLTNVSGGSYTTPPASTVVNFDSVDTSGGAVSGTPVTNYLASYGITFSSQSGTPDIAPYLPGNPYPNPVSSPNFFGVSGPNSGFTYTFSFASPLNSLSFTVPGLGTTSSMAAWSATAYSTTGTQLSEVGDPSLSFPGTQNQTYTLAGPGIAYVQFSDNVENAAGNHFAFDNLTLNSVPTGTWTGTAAQFNALTFTTGEQGNYNLDITATNSTITTTASESYTLTVNPAAEGPLLGGATSAAVNAGGSVTLGGTDTAADTDDTLGNVTITGLPTDLTNLNGGTYTASTGTWTGTAAQFDALSFTAGETTGSFNLAIMATTTGPETGTTTGTFTLAINPATPTGTPSLITLVDFTHTDGANPFAGLIADPKGDLFGTTTHGGANGDGGTVFEIVNNGTVTAPSYGSAPTTIVEFAGGNGANPYAGLIADANGDLFGTTPFGGLSVGNVFEITNNGTATAPSYGSNPTVIANFNASNGANPYAGLTADAAGDLFGTTANWGADGDGTVFEIVNNGTVTAPSYASNPTTLVNFNGSNGANPYADLIVDANGDLFGTTLAGGRSDHGTVFEIVNNGTVATPSYVSSPTTIVNFDGSGSNIGEYPRGGLIADANGDLFGTTDGGGANGDGSVFEMVTNGTVSAPTYASTPITLSTSTAVTV